MDPHSLARWCRHALPQEAATLAFIREGRHDIRPGLLQMFHAGDPVGQDAIIRHGRCYLQAWAGRRGKQYPREVYQAAAVDALCVMLHRRASLPVAARSRELGLRNAVYSDLRQVLIEMYQTRLHEARVRFISGTIYTSKSVGLKIGLTPPSDASRAAPGSGQQFELQWAA